MSRSGRSIWPPKWTTTRKFEPRPRGEIGTLEDVLMNGKRCFLVIRHEARTYLGALSLSSAQSAKRIFEFLREHVGRPIKDIGDREVPFT
jgi:hypothetical protein